MADTRSIEDYIEGQAGSPQLDALAVLEAKSYAEAVVQLFQDEHGEPYGEWPPREFVKLCQKVAEFDVPEPPA